LFSHFGVGRVGIGFFSTMALSDRVEVRIPAPPPYARIIEIPTLPWTACDAVRIDHDLPEGIPLTARQRACSSPIWYSPH
jgi:hypothetical protein